MPAQQYEKKNRPKATKHAAPNDGPQFFRQLNIEVGDLKSAVSFYTKLLGIEGRKQAGSRCKVPLPQGAADSTTHRALAGLRLRN